MAEGNIPTTTTGQAQQELPQQQSLNTTDNQRTSTSSETTQETDETVSSTSVQTPTTQTALSTTNSNSNTSLRLGFSFNAMEDSTRIIANNLSTTIEISPLLNLSRSRPALSFQEWLNPNHQRQIQQQQQQQPQQQSPVVEHHRDSDSVIINVDGPNFNNDTSSQSTNSNNSEHSAFGENFNLQDNANNPSSTNNNNTDNADGNSNQSLSNARRRAAQRTIDSYVPFLTILFTKAIYDNGAEILNFVILVATFIQANNDLKREILKQQNRSHMMLLGILCYIIGCFIFINFIFVFIFNEPTFLFYSPPDTILQLIWTVAVTDYILKLITVCIKVLLTCLPTWIIPFQKRGKYYLMIEATSQLVRCNVPLKPWLYYLCSIYQGPDKMLGMALFLIYSIHKGGDIMTHLRQFLTAAWKMLQDVSLGVSPTKEQIAASGGTCAICHEEYSIPVRLHCKHIFCESCVATWLDRERSCPLCRAFITDDPIYRDGHTTHYVQLY